MEALKISSAQNPRIKELLALQEKSRLRRERGLFVVEGRREVERCLAAGFTAEAIFYCPALLGQAALLHSLNTVTQQTACPRPSPCQPEQQVADWLRNASPTGSTLCVSEPTATCSTDSPTIYEITEALYEKVAYRGGTEGVIAIIRERRTGLEELHLSEKPLIVVLESVEKPGNLGAVLRSADAAGADAVIICDPLTDLWNPNLIRASLGAAFSVQCVAVESGEAIKWLKAKGISILTAQLQDSVLYYDCDMTRPTAIVIGTESTGLSNEWREAAERHIRIPMLGMMDSLNASVSAAILLFEALRQRR